MPVVRRVGAEQPILRVHEEDVAGIWRSRIRGGRCWQLAQWGDVAHRTGIAQHVPTADRVQLHRRGRPSGQRDRHGVPAIRDRMPASAILRERDAVDGVGGDTRGQRVVHVRVQGDLLHGRGVS